MRHRRRVTVLILLFSLVSAFLTTGIGSVAAQDFTVLPGQSIQAAIDAAPSGSTIRVRAGTYAENLYIYKDGITLEGVGASSTFLVPPAPEDVLSTPCNFEEEPEPEQLDSYVTGICIHGEVDGPEVLDPVSNTTITGFTVEGFSDTGILAIGTEHLQVKHNVTPSNGDYGIAAFVSTGVLFHANVAYNNGFTGLYIGDSPQAHAVVTLNEAYDNNGFGMFIREASQGFLGGNTFFGNCIGVLFLSEAEGSNWWVGSFNQVYANNRVCEDGPEETTSGAGIVIVGSHHVSLLHNNVFDHQADTSVVEGGIVVISAAMFGGSDPSDILVAGNTALNNTPDLFWDETGTNILFVANVCETSVPEGLCASAPQPMMDQWRQ